MIFKAFFTSMGICKWRANPFPEPRGMMPSALLLCTSERATSFTVPSPPTATTISTPSSAAFFANSAAWPAYSVRTISYVKSVASIPFSICLRTEVFFFTPEIGFTIKRICLLSIVRIFPSKYFSLRNSYYDFSFPGCFCVYCKFTDKYDTLQIRKSVFSLL